MTAQAFFVKLWQLNRTLPLLCASLLLLLLAVVAVNHWIFSLRVQELQKTYFEQRDLLRQGGNGSGHTAVDGFEKDKEGLAAFRSQIGARSDFTDFIGELFSLADRSGLSIDRVKYEPDEIAEHDLLRYGLSFSVVGQYGKIKKFIFSLEQSERIIIIEEMALAGSSEANSGEAHLKISLSTYFGAGSV